MKYIFVQIACYRDEEIVSTIEDCIKQAENPRRLRFGICWQKNPEDDYLAKYQSDDNFKILKFPYTVSKGVCWARNKIQKLYDGEDFILQLDSHHRFVPNWDKILLDSIKRTDSQKPILSTYGTPYFSGGGMCLDVTPCRIGYYRFTESGILLQKPHYMDEYRHIKRPELARFLSCHFLFTTGDFIADCPYDPKLYFHGEEILTAVKAYTHGYDIYHPNKLVLWHLYAKGVVNHHAYDHDPYTQENGPYWSNLEVESVRRIRSLLNIPPHPSEPPNTKKTVNVQKKYSLGTKRTLEEYERFAGVNFKLQSVQKYTDDDNIPPNPHVLGDTYDWEKSFEKSQRIVAEFDPKEIDTSEDDYTFWYVGAHDINNNEVYRKDLPVAQTSKLLQTNPIRLSLTVTSYHTPTTCTIWPYSPSKGWLSKTTKHISL